jgi:hypothetical protein
LGFARAQAGRHPPAQRRVAQPLSLALALREFRRIERTLFTLQSAFAGDVEALIGQITDPPEAEPEQMAECKPVVREPSRIGVVLFNPQLGFVMEQTVEHVSRIAE